MSDSTDTTDRSIAADNFNELARLHSALLAVTNEYNAALEIIVQLNNSLEVQQQRNESLTSINAEVEQENEKMAALLVEVYNCARELDGTGAVVPPDVIIKDAFADRMRDLGLLEETP